MSVQEYERINQEIIETQKALRERGKVLAIMESIDKQLVVEKSRLQKLIAIKHYKNYDVRALEEFTFKSLYHTLRRNRKEQLESDAQAFLEAKRDVEGCQTKISSLENNLAELESSLIELAESDEKLAALEQEQISLIRQIDVSKAELLKIINYELSNKKLNYHGTEKACKVGKQLLSELNRVIDLVKNITVIGGFKKLLIESIDPLDAAVQSSLNFEPLLLQFDQALATISQQFWTSSKMQIPQFKMVTVYPDFSRYDYKNIKENQKLIREWLSQLQQLQRRVSSKVDVLEIELSTLAKRIEQIEREKQQILTEFWKPSKFS